MEKKRFFPSDQGSTWTHLVGTLFAISCMWMVWPAVHISWQMAFGVLFFISGMFLMFLSSTLYHWVWPGKVKNALRKVDHISIYVMIACSYTPICVGLIGGWLGWLVFGLLWGVVVAGTFYKIFAIDKWPKLSLALYLMMGWAVVFIAPQVFSRLTLGPMLFLIAEGILYTAGTYFFAHDDRKYYHSIWHVFVLLGAMAHWSVVMFLIL